MALQDSRSHSSCNKMAQALKDIKIGGIWKCGRKIGSGSFGDIYKGKRLTCFRLSLLAPR